MKDKILTLFFAVGIGELIAVSADIVPLEWVCKPLLLPILGFYYIKNISKEDTWSRPVLAAILFSWIGDVALMLQVIHANFFLVGLSCFLVAHVAYILAYRQHKWVEGDNVLFGVQKFRFAFPIILAGAGLVTILYSHLGDLLVPVMIYALTIVAMVLQALFRYGLTNNLSFWFVMVGALLFMASDSAIAIDKFLSHFGLAQTFVMSTYIGAQLLIVRGLTFHRA
ncbi:MAG: lysoplasmalogenase [Cyclobacteriaceae bacterium]|nr:lysoplasmalogenase [Cyclobacteriaceae bacterium]